MRESASLTRPGAHRSAGLADDGALVGAMLRVERAWTEVLAELGAATTRQAKNVADAAERLTDQGAGMLDPNAVEAGGNPVIPLVAALRARVDTDTAKVVHRGLTSQDVLDTAMMLLARKVIDVVGDELTAAASALDVAAERHRGSVMAGRTLTQFAVPVTFGLLAAQWLLGVLDARDRLGDVRAALPVQCGGAAGTLSRTAELVDDPLQASALLADRLGLARSALPWHTRRTPVTRLADALVECCDALGVIACDVLVLGRPEIDEVREGAAPGRGGSSTMPHKRNPVLAVLVRAAALQAPPLAAQLHTGAGQAVDQRPDGSWHAEWPALSRLFELAATAAGQARELVEGLEVRADVMAARARDHAALLLAERGSPQRDAGSELDPASYLGVAERLVDAARARLGVRAGIVASVARPSSPGSRGTVSVDGRRT